MRSTAAAVLALSLVVASCAPAQPSRSTERLTLPPTAAAVPAAPSDAGADDTPEPGDPAAEPRRRVGELEPSSNLWRAISVFLTGLGVSLRVQGGCC